MKLVLFLWKKPGETRVYTSTAAPSLERWKSLKEQGYIYYQLMVEIPDLTEIKPDKILHTKAENLDLPIEVGMAILYKGVNRTEVGEAHGETARVVEVGEKFVDVLWEKNNARGTFSLDAFRQKLLDGTFIHVR